MNLFTIFQPILPIVFVVFGFLVVLGIGAFVMAQMGLISGGDEESGDEVGKEKKMYSYRHKQFFMTRAENGFYQGLVRAVGDRYAIFAQVHLPDIVDEKVPGQDWRAARTRINRKSIDFVLCDKEYLNPKLAIELDDASHEREERQARDAFVEEVLCMAELPLLRVHYSENIDVEELKKRIAAAL
jgi:very-short-patch-repair endonuclease